MERIHSAAIKYTSARGTQHVAFGPKRHKDILVGEIPKEGHWGYWTTHDRFVSRQTAAGIAIHAGQALRISNDRLGLQGHDLVWGYKPCEAE